MALTAGYGCCDRERPLVPSNTWMTTRLALHLHDTAGAFGAIFQTDEDRLFKGGVPDTVQGNQGTR